jgi:hypothetical protein
MEQQIVCSLCASGNVPKASPGGALVHVLEYDVEGQTTFKNRCFECANSPVHLATLTKAPHWTKE